MREISFINYPADIVDYDERLMAKYATTWPFLQMIPVMYENQGVWHLAVSLKKGDDPPVYLGYQGDNSFEWYPHIYHFSDFIYAWVWDYVMCQREGDEASTSLVTACRPWACKPFQISMYFCIRAVYVGTFPGPLYTLLNC